MDRRGFLGATGASAMEMAGKTSAGPLLGLPDTRRPDRAPPEMDEYVKRIDDGMEQLSQWSPSVDLRDGHGDPIEVQAMLRTSLQSLFLTGMVADLPLEAQIRPEIQLRIERASPIFDEATDRTMAFLKSRTPDDLDRIQSRLQNPAVGERIVNMLDERAAEAGISDWRRAHTRAIFKETEWRLRTQPPALLVDEYVEKIERLTASDVLREVRTRDLAARAGEEAFWQQTTANLQQNTALGRGARVMGYGVLTFAVGALIVAAGAFAGVFVMTAGAVIFIVGIIMALVAAARTA
jgi:hypothetical protein